jgi:S1-C subfamily serine protease
MNRPFKALLLVVGLAAAVLIGMMMRRSAAQSGGGASSPSVSRGAGQALSNSVEFVKDRVKGGVGVSVAIQSGSKLPVVGAVAIGSPANEAGLYTGDIITSIGGVSTTNLPLKQVVDNLRGFTGARVQVTVLRGTNYIDFVIRRTSMSSLKAKTFGSGQ